MASVCHAACGALAVMLAAAIERPVSAHAGGLVWITSDDARPRCVQARGRVRAQRRERGCRGREADEAAGKREQQHDLPESRLLDTVKRLAAPTDEQAAYLRRLGSYSYSSLDKLALEFDGAFAAA
jgi:hypothetical protein